jgi:ribosomal RNA-processing protein 36
MSEEQDNEAKSKDFKRLNKNRPQEISSKKRVSSFRNVFQVKKTEFIDPRFNSAFGEYKPEFFRKRYSFIHEMRIKEKDVSEWIGKMFSFI